MKILYVRISTLDQKTDRQKVNAAEYDMVIEDIISGAVPFQERVGGKRILQLLEQNVVDEVSVWQIDRIGRDIRDIINTLHLFTSKKVCVHFINQGLKTLDCEGNENPISKMVINLLGIIAEMERGIKTLANCLIDLYSTPCLLHEFHALTIMVIASRFYMILQFKKGADRQRNLEDLKLQVEEQKPLPQETFTQLINNILNM